MDGKTGQYESPRIRKCISVCITSDGTGAGCPECLRLKKEDLILRIQQAEAERQGLELRGGILEIMSEGIGFLRSGHYQPGPYDVYVSQSQIRRYSLRNGDLVIGQCPPAARIGAPLRPA